MGIAADVYEFIDDVDIVTFPNNKRIINLTKLPLLICDVKLDPQQPIIFDPLQPKVSMKNDNVFSDILVRRYLFDMHQIQVLNSLCKEVDVVIVHIDWLLSLHNNGVNYDFTNILSIPFTSYGADQYISQIDNLSKYIDVNLFLF